MSARRERKTAEIALSTGISASIIEFRGHRVLLDSDLSGLYGVSTGRLNEAVRRNRERFPSDFMFQLPWAEARSLISQTATSKPGRGGRRKDILAFTEQGVAMLSSVLRSPRAIRVNIEIMRAFVRLREFAGAHADVVRRLDALERRYDGQFRSVFDAIRRLVTPPVPPRRRIGFAPIDPRSPTATRPSRALTRVRRR